MSGTCTDRSPIDQGLARGQGAGTGRSRGRQRPSSVDSGPSRPSDQDGGQGDGGNDERCFEVVADRSATHDCRASACSISPWPSVDEERGAMGSRYRRRREGESSSWDVVRPRLHLIIVRSGSQRRPKRRSSATWELEASSAIGCPRHHRRPLSTDMNQIDGVQRAAVQRLSPACATRHTECSCYDWPGARGGDRSTDLIGSTRRSQVVEADSRTLKRCAVRDCTR